MDFEVQPWEVQYEKFIRDAEGCTGIYDAAYMEQDAIYAFMEKEWLVNISKIIEEHPEDVFAKTGRAEVLKSLNRLNEALNAYEATIKDHPENMVARNGRAEVLKSLNRLDEALNAYDEIAERHPENVVARNGRAEVLKSLNRLAESNAAYKQILSDHPWSLVARNGRACVLRALKRWDDALALLPVKDPQLIEDWIGYHIRGTILLRKGEWASAVRIFNEGRSSNLPQEIVDRFRMALAVASLHEPNYEIARDTLDEVVTPVAQASKEVLQLHAYGGLGERDRAAEIYATLQGQPEFGRIKEVSERIRQHYVDGETTEQNDEWFLEQEIECIGV